jgi:hypothetical protein
MICKKKTGDSAIIYGKKYLVQRDIEDTTKMTFFGRDTLDINIETVITETLPPTDVVNITKR